MNSVHLIGRLATDVEVKEVGEGSKVSSFTLAVDPPQPSRRLQDHHLGRLSAEAV